MIVHEKSICFFMDATLAAASATKRPRRRGGVPRRPGPDERDAGRAPYLRGRLVTKRLKDPSSSR